MLQTLTSAGVSFLVALLVTIAVMAALRAMERRGFDPVDRLARIVSPEDRGGAEALDSTLSTEAPL